MRTLDTKRCVGVVLALGMLASCGTTAPPASGEDAGVITPDVVTTTALAGAVEGVVTDAQGGRVPNAMVTLTMGNRTGQTVTSALGQFAFGTLAPGVYSYAIVQMPMGYSGTGLVAVRAGSVTPVTLVATGGPRFEGTTPGDPFRGARLWDDFRFYNTTMGTGMIAGSLRCRACHGWFGDTPVGPAREVLTEIVRFRSEPQLAYFIREGEGMMSPYRGVFVASFQPEQQYVDLAAFLKQLLRVVPTTGGRTMEGQVIYGGQCIRCHGAQGQDIDFHADGRSPPPEYLGAAREEPFEFAHRIWYGHPRPDAQQNMIWGLVMPAFRNFTPAQVSSLIAYLQTLPE